MNPFLYAISESNFSIYKTCCWFFMRAKIAQMRVPFSKMKKKFPIFVYFFCIFTLFLSCFANFWKIASLSSYPWICSNLDWFGGNWILESTYNLWKLGKFLNGRTEVSLKNSFLVPYFSGKFRTLSNNYDKAFFKKKVND